MALPPQKAAGFAEFFFPPFHPRHGVAMNWSTDDVLKDGLMVGRFDRLQP